MDPIRVLLSQLPSLDNVFVNIFENKKKIKDPFNTLNPQDKDFSSKFIGGLPFQNLYVTQYVMWYITQCVTQYVTQYVSNAVCNVECNAEYNSL